MNTMVKENLKVPKLRFGEFSGAWEETKLKKYISQISGFAFKGEEISEVEGGIRLLRGINITEGKIRHSKEIDRFYHGNDISKLTKFLVKKDDLVIGMDGSKVGKNIALITEEEEGNLLVQRVCCIRPVNSNINFIYQIINNYRFHRYVDIVNTSSGIPHISSKQIDDYLIAMPTLAEQEKIANYLSALDEKLNLLSEKEKNLAQYKKAMMQKLFAQEIRFKDDEGKEFEAWEEKKLGEVFTHYNGLTGKTKENFGIGKPYIKYTQVFGDSKIDITNFDFVEITADDKQNVAQFGDAFFTVSSETPHEVGMSSVLLDEVEEVYLNSFCFGIRPIDKSLNPYYYRYFFRSKDFRNEVIKLAQGSTRYNMSKIEFMKIKISIPCLAEQEKIAQFLSAIDEKINAVQKQIAAMQEFKKAMLQQMFV